MFIQHYPMSRFCSILFILTVAHAWLNQWSLDWQPFIQFWEVTIHDPKHLHDPATSAAKIIAGWRTDFLSGEMAGFRSNGMQWPCSVFPEATNRKVQHWFVLDVILAKRANVREASAAGIQNNQGQSLGYEWPSMSWISCGRGPWNHAPSFTTQGSKKQTVKRSKWTESSRIWWP